MKTTYLIIFFVILHSSVYAIDVPIFSKYSHITIPYAKCDNSKAIHIVKIDELEGDIAWKWENKYGSWGGWRIENLSDESKNFSMTDFLIIKFSGEYQGDVPEIRLIDSKDRISDKVKFSDSYFIGTNKDKSRGVEMIIPVKNFFITNRPFDISNIKIIQFDAGIRSNIGKVKINYIGLFKD